MAYLLSWRGASMDQKILCEVNNCSYWGRGNKCTADAIYVVSHTGETAEKSEETDCKTFKPQDL
ncbi:hypothetical protein AW02_029170 [Bacillus velezensis NJN-6]|nr:hypothetical protein AW02_029170 [Bacillus velezensis NJN-6]MCB5334012.1 hypothetical protein [Bacillus amyloliquefaciens]ODS08588.1 uncharacterized protein BSHJ18_03024 [Bacillus velezensis]PWK01937.1 uncharacterized protein DUF1540 [Bacillus sp. VMFN-A1]CCF06320.1 hypothetical protein BACAU_2786 [Bacillus velezensis CAU B946]